MPSSYEVWVFSKLGTWKNSSLNISCQIEFQLGTWFPKIRHFSPLAHGGPRPQARERPHINVHMWEDWEGFGAAAGAGSGPQALTPFLSLHAPPSSHPLQTLTLTSTSYSSSCSCFPLNSTSTPSPNAGTVPETTATTSCSCPSSLHCSLWNEDVTLSTNVKCWGLINKLSWSNIFILTTVLSVFCFNCVYYGFWLFYLFCVVCTGLLLILGGTAEVKEE